MCLEVESLAQVIVNKEQDSGGGEKFSSVHILALKSCDQTLKILVNMMNEEWLLHCFFNL